MTNNTFNNLAKLSEEFKLILKNLECHLNKLEFERMVEEFEYQAQH